VSENKNVSQHADWSLRELDRRRFLQTLGGAGLGVAAGGLLAACGAGSGGSTAGIVHTTAGAGLAASTPKPGGRLRVANAGNGTSESFNPALVASPIDFLHANSVFDVMVRPAPNYGREPGLVMQWNPSKDATSYELKLRPGVTWHDGKPFGADDMIYTLRFIGQPKNLGNAAVANVRLDQLKKIDELTVKVPLKLPIADLAAYFLDLNASYVVQDGATDFTNPIGTGPYKLESFTPGQQAVLSANRDYWDSPRPYPDELEIISIDDSTARVNALLGGRIDICQGLTFADARANLDGGQYTVVVGAPGEAYTIYMRCDSGPFKDVRVREAMKLIVDRQQMIDDTLSGFGTVGNDIMGHGARYFDHGLPQHSQDIERAKSLLKSAGAADLKVTLNTAPVLPGFVESATVFAQQAAAAGVQVEVKQEQVSSYFNPAISFLKQTFAQDIWAAPSLNGYYSQALLTNSPINETHWHSASFDRLFYKAQGATNEQEAQELWSKLQRIQWKEGGNIAWCYYQSTDGVSSAVRGYGGPGTGWMYGNDDLRVWNWGLG